MTFINQYIALLGRLGKKMTDNEKRFIKGIFSGDSSGHDYYHTIRVYKLATKIAKQENADVKTVQLAALLHDVDDIKLSPDTYATKKNAVDFMTINKIDGKRIEAVCNIIDEVSFAGSTHDRGRVRGMSFCLVPTGTRRRGSVPKWKKYIF